ncbi:MAG: hypothetical protein K2I79_03860, partial [Clostridia bacterium]|nr:hypothetical protein [Clostridia bacterium]
LAIGILLFVLGLGGVFGRSVGHFPCSYEKIVKDVDLLPKLIKEDGLREYCADYDGGFIIYPENLLVNNLHLLNGKEPAIGYKYIGTIGGVYGWAIKKDSAKLEYVPNFTFEEYGEMAENTGIKSTWGEDIYYLPDREVYLNKYYEVLYCDYVVDDNTFFRYMYVPGRTASGEDISKEQAIEIFNKIFVLI